MSSPPGTTLVPPRLRVRTVAVPDPGPLVALLPETDAIAWLRGGDGMVAWGEVVRHKAARPSDAEEWWTALVAQSDVESDLDVAVPGSGLVAFGSFVFDPDNTSASSGMVVPRTVLGRRSGRAWLTQIGVEDDEDRPGPVAGSVPPAPDGVRFEGGSLTSEQWRAVVSRAVGDISRGLLDKVVLARDLVAVADTDLDGRWLVGRLSETYPRCWTYLVDGLIGSTPEMLIRLEAGLATSRVLAGTIQRTGDGRTDLARADALAHSSKDLEEHEYAVASVAAALDPFCSALNVPEHPYVLELPNVLHLASDVTAAVAPGVTALGLAAALHPSAAVCGTPTDLARDRIAELEHLDRERYAGPVGWTDASGAGEWAIALRCGILDETDRRRIRLFAGCGIVAGSDPEAEWAEAQAKLAPMISALVSPAPVRPPAVRPALA